MMRIKVIFIKVMMNKSFIKNNKRKIDLFFFNFIYYFHSKIYRMKNKKVNSKFFRYNKFIKHNKKIRFII